MKTIQAKIRRIVAGTDVSVEVMSINANYDPVEVRNNLSDVIQHPEFVSAIPEEGACYEIQDNGDNFEVNEITTVAECEDQFVMMLRSAYTLMHTLQYIHWNSHGEQFDVIHSYSDNMSWMLRSQIDRIAEWMVMDCGSVPHPDTFVCRDGHPACENYGFKLEPTMNCLFEVASCFVAALEVFYCNLSHERKAIVDMWINDWKHECEYRVARSLLPTGCNVACPIPCTL